MLNVGRNPIPRSEHRFAISRGYSGGRKRMPFGQQPSSVLLSYSGPLYQTAGNTSIVWPVMAK